MIMPHEHQVTTVDLLRHGECEGGHVYRGSLDLPLSETGWEQLRSKAGEFQRMDAYCHIAAATLRTFCNRAGRAL
jgi:alpha-ribazole phosphatase